MIIPVFCLQDHSSRRCRPYFQPSPRKFSVDLNPIWVRPFASETIVHRDLWRRPLIVLLIFQTPKSPCLTWTWRHFEYWVDLFLSRRLHFFLIFVWLLLFSSSSLLHPPTPPFFSSYFFFFFMHCIQLASGWETVLCGFFPPQLFGKPSSAEWILRAFFACKIVSVVWKNHPSSFPQLFRRSKKTDLLKSRTDSELIGKNLTCLVLPSSHIKEKKSINSVTFFCLFVFVTAIFRSFFSSSSSFLCFFCFVFVTAIFSSLGIMHSSKLVAHVITRSWQTKAIFLYTFVMIYGNRRSSTQRRSKAEKQKKEDGYPERKGTRETRREKTKKKTTTISTTVLHTALSSCATQFGSNRHRRTFMN